MKFTTTHIGLFEGSPAKIIELVIEG